MSKYEVTAKGHTSYLICCTESKVLGEALCWTFLASISFKKPSVRKETTYFPNGFLLYVAYHHAPLNY